MSRTSGGATTAYTWNPSARLRAGYAAGLPVILQETTGAATTTYVCGLGMVFWADAAANVTYRLADGLGSTVALANAGGAITDTYTYDVFGAVRSHSGASATEFTFTGEQNDAKGTTRRSYVQGI